MMMWPGARGLLFVSLVASGCGSRMGFEPPDAAAGVAESCGGDTREEDASRRIGAPCDGPDGDLCPEGIITGCSSGRLVCSDASVDDPDSCDGVDNDCDPASADGAEDPALNLPCDGPDHDLCREGTLAACSGGRLVCTDLSGDDVELCDGLDNDCDPASADGAEDPRLSGTCDGPDDDLCPEGTYTGCASGLLGCADATGDDPDSCDGLDNDCDPASADGAEDPALGGPCDGPDTDLCREGIVTGCSGGRLACSDSSGDTLEIAGDGIDGDCDGVELCLVDGDGDGFLPIGPATVVAADLDCLDAGEAVAGTPTGDCRDDLPLVSPAAREGPVGDGSCADLVDNDCDGVEGAADGGCDAACPWLDPRWGFRVRLTVTNGSAKTAAPGYTLVLELDHRALVLAGQARVDGNDLRLAHCDGAGASTELDRVDEGPYVDPAGASSFGTASARLAFPLASSLSPAESDPGYFLYFGDPTAAPAPSNLAAVFDFFEPFDSLAAWTQVGAPGASISAGALRLSACSTGELLYLTGAAGDRSQSAGFAVRARARQDSIGNDLSPAGWYLNTTSGLRFDVASSSSRNRIRRLDNFADTSATAVATDGGATPPQAAQWYVYEATVDGNAFAYRRDGIELLSGTDATATAGKVFLGAEGDIPVRWDWLLIRRFVDPEPTVATGAVDRR
ncbi:MAG: hypothetical protein HY903_22650 [Deltaproteobacteria bacterium]|nr:hypothetical protein [Deltaproteobacteria bacterium]